MPFNSTAIASSNNDVRGAYNKTQRKRREIDEFIHGGPPPEQTFQTLNQMVRKTEPQPIYKDIARQHMSASEFNPTKVNNNYTHFRVWNRDTNSRNDIPMNPEMIMKPNPESRRLQSYGSNNTMSLMPNMPDAEH